jgi:ubiquinone/menaquinone biosynthesis C-methylase UbiE
VERILDLGCGTGDSWRKLGLDVENRCVIGIDVKQTAYRLRIAHSAAEDSVTYAHGVRMYHCGMEALIALFPMWRCLTCTFRGYWRNCTEC